MSEESFELGTALATVNYLRKELDKANRTILRLYAVREYQPTCFTCFNSTEFVGYCKVKERDCVGTKTCEEWR